MNSPNGVSIERSSNVWIINSGDAGVSEITHSTTLTYANYNGAGKAEPLAIANQSPMMPL